MLNRYLFSQRTSPTHEACHYIQIPSLSIHLLHTNLQCTSSVITNVFQLCTCTLKIKMHYCIHVGA